jgi:ABC-2 type transport system permease protein
MNAMLLVAAREFRQIASTRSFWLTLLLLPVALGVSQAMAVVMREPAGVAYVVVDESGRFAPDVNRRIALDHQRQVLGDLAGYAQRWKIAPEGAVWAGGPRWFSEGDVAAFGAAGGLPAAQAELERLKPRGAPDFHPPEPRAVAVAPPEGVATREGAVRFGETLAPHLDGDVPTAYGKRPLALGVFIPRDLGRPGVSVAMWTNGRANTVLVEAVRNELSRQLRAEALKVAGVGPELAALETVTAPVALHVPPSGGGRDRLVLRSALPLALSYLLLMSLMISGAWMLQGLMEERSNKLLEAVLACVSPNELLYGKLIGVVSIGMVMILTWIACAIGAAFAVEGVVADFLRPAVASLNSPWIVAALVFFFLAGYLCISMVFLAVGAMSENMRDAQGHLTPIILALALPFVAVMRSVLQDPDGPLPRILSWIPFYSPFAMMARLGGGVSPWEVLGSALLLAAFVALELWLLSRIFRATLLAAGQPMRFKDLGRLVRRPTE